MLWAYIRVPGMYGSIRVLMVAYITFGIAMGVRSMRGVFEQMNKDLEQSAAVHGARPLQVLRYIVFPLVRPGLIAGWFVLAILFSRELAASVMLYGPGSQVVSVVLLGYWQQGQGNSVTVLCVVIMGALLVLYTLERFLTVRAAGRTRPAVT
jgi:iron(III) transport system permease protein